MTRPGRYPQELRERAVRLVFEHQDEHPSQWVAITFIAHKFGVSAETLRKWVRNAETDDGLRPSPPHSAAARSEPAASSAAQPRGRERGTGSGWPPLGP